ncbi:MAG: Rne/Rng family ribonuclease [Pseudomonadota bacterium]
MSKLMLIDAVHPEETRVAVASDGLIEDFDFEAKDKRQLRGNIYLAKVTRVEPSLQAAFVEYGGNRHGFLAFSEIHPDYYQIPQADREALLAEEAAAAERLHDEDVDEDDVDVDDDMNVDASDDDLALADDADADAASDEDGETSDDAEERRPRTRRRPPKRYKIQEVIKRRQVLLIQVVKEERGNKGAALTTYLSLAGRYCVLMPNTARGGGISRKITNAADRKRLKKITEDFDLGEGMGLIVRTAGAKRTKTEIERDYEYLIRLWSTIRETTLESIAPCLIHEEGHLVLRAVRDLYDKDVENIHVQGDKAYKEAKSFVEMLMPSHAKKVVKHEAGAPLFVAHGVEPQLDNIFSPTVQLPSGGYLVINQTEALVAIDVNSGKATRERNIETTATKTNLEAAAEAARQMRLRDLAGLIVIDFIDMEESKNNRAVEKKMKECLAIDRARVQTGRISQFGLFEISRQRRRAGVLELSSEPCKTCDGTGRTRSIGSAALQLLRATEARASDDRVDTVTVEAPSEVALYILNEKRGAVASIEETFGVSIRIEARDELKPGDFNIEATSDGKSIAYKPILPKPDSGKKRRQKRHEEPDIDDEADLAADAEDGDEAKTGEDAGKGRRRGRRGGRKRRGQDADASALDVIDQDGADGDTDEDGGGRGRRGRRRRSRRRTPDVALDGGEMLDAIASAPFLAPDPVPSETPDEDASGSADDQDAPPPKDEVETPEIEDASARKPAETIASEPEDVTTEAEPEAETDDTTSDVEPETASGPDPKAETEPEAPAEPQLDEIPAIETKSEAPETPPEAAIVAEPEESKVHAIHETVVAEPPKKRRGGWWSRKG